MPRDVKDIDRGWRKAVKALTGVGKPNLRIGMLSGTPKYPRKQGKTEVAKVGAVLGLVKAFTAEFDASLPEIERGIVRARDKLIRGASTEEALLGIGRALRRRYRRVARLYHTPRSGRLLTSIRAALYDGAKFVAGDDPGRPRMGDATTIPSN